LYEKVEFIVMKLRFLKVFLYLYVRYVESYKIIS